MRNSFANHVENPRGNELWDLFFFFLQTYPFKGLSRCSEIPTFALSIVAHKCHKPNIVFILRFTGDVCLLM